MHNETFTCIMSRLHRFFKRNPRPPLGDTERFSGGFEQSLLLGSFAVTLHNASVTVY